MRLNVTDAARDHINAVVEKQQGQGFRLSIKKNGCSGYAYLPSVVDAVKTGDHRVIVNEVTLFIDPLWQHLLEDITIDVVEEVRSGLKQKRLMITNAKEAGRCGCGESFHVDE